MTQSTRSAVIRVMVTLTAVIGLAAFFLFQRVEINRFKSNPGDYTVVVTERRYERFLPAMPGGGRDGPAFVEVFNSRGVSCGLIPLPMLQFIDEFRRTPTGAEITLVGRWDFKTCTCSY